MPLAFLNNAYLDELISATELNRQPGHILDKAAEHPVTITRNGQFFALLPREEVTCLVKTAIQSKAVFESLTVAFSLLLGKEIGFEHPYGWLSVFDSDELQEFIKELSKAFRLVDSSTTAWKMIDAIIHEWHESAIAISSPELAAAFNDETDEIPLTQPSVENAK
ncbi:type II toxin-antitoxin system prevent-host-death family antitoxin [Calothrix sp. NIES-2098]|uniref:type II toxin-antitoxin system prevent-host-death family antitoxin n=1 Tax=Calothrix sp. NIES-2098 TaxID=1954171 RepID=UPI000BBC23EF